VSSVRTADPKRHASLSDGSSQMRAIGTIIENVADTDATVLIRGERGLGKDLVARAIHSSSSRRDGPFVKVNCAAIPSGLLESEFFGHEKEAFAGAHQRSRPRVYGRSHGGRRGLHRVDWNRAAGSRILRVSYKTLLHKIVECGLPPLRRQSATPRAGGLSR
jgi:transcriptional regulator of acetoin/glycerol metabolism